MSGVMGSTAYLSWIHSGGTIALSSAFRSWDYTPSVELKDQSAGADANKSYLVGQKDGQASFQMVLQSGGSATVNALIEGAIGTVVWGPEGTASGKPKFTIPMISMGAKLTVPYNDIEVIDVTFQQNGVRVDASY